MCEWADLHVFTIKNNKVVKLSDIEGCCTYFQGNDYIICDWAWKGDDFRIIKITYSGTVS